MELKFRPFVCFLFVFTFSPCVTLAGEERPERKLASEVQPRCETTKEFITTYEYLMDHKELGIKGSEAQDTAAEVSKGCTGAASRFVKIFELLIKSEAGPRSSLQTAVDLAKKPESYTQTFVTIFTKSFLSEYLDLDYNTSFDLARNLATEYKGNPQIAAIDFNKLVEFCVNDQHVGLSKPQCGVIAGRIVKKAEDFHAQIANEFIKVYNFLVSGDGPSATVAQAMEISEKITAQGPEAPDNFIAAYKYSVKKSGLDKTAQESIRFAENLSQHTAFRTRPDEFKANPLPSEDRLPAAK